MNRGPSFDELVTERMAALGLTHDVLSTVTQIPLHALQHISVLGDEALTLHQWGQLSPLLGIDLASYDPEEDVAPEPLPEVTTLLRSTDAHLPPEYWATVQEASQLAQDIVILEQILGLPDRFQRLCARFASDADLGTQPWQRGQQLAQHTRALLGLSSSDPIVSVYDLCARLDVLVLEAKLHDDIQGLCFADAAHGPTILLNTQGRNARILPRRAALAHELAHVLYDRHDLQPLRAFDTYERAKEQPPVESRANAFAAYLLAPEAPIRAWQQALATPPTPSQTIKHIMHTHGVSFSAAAVHALHLGLLSDEDYYHTRVPGLERPAALRFWEHEARHQPQPILGSSHPVACRQLRPLVIRALQQRLITHSRASELLRVNHNRLTRLLDATPA